MAQLLPQDPEQGFPPPQPQQPPQPNYLPQLLRYVYGQPQQGYQPPVHLTNRLVLNKIRICYGIIVVGSAIVLISTFLAWLNMQQFNNNFSYEASINGFGQANGDLILITAARKTMGNNFAGGFVFIGAILMVIRCLSTLIGFLRYSTRFSIYNLLFGICGIILYIYNMLIINQAVDTMNQNNQSVTSTLGPGVPLGLFACLIILVSSIANLILTPQLKLKGNSDNPTLDNGYYINQKQN